LSELKTRGILENTLLIITSDHGEEFGEHQLFGHGASLYWPSLFVPLLISFPSHVPGGQKIRTPVTLRDLAATVLDLLKIDAKKDIQGSSLAKYWDNADGVENAKEETPILLSEVSQGVRTPESWPISKGSMKSLVTDRFHYIIGADGIEELFDIRSDPFETQNLSESMEYRPDKEQFEAYLNELLRSGKASY
jgi:arylsulfatase A-like enzyme